MIFVPWPTLGSQGSDQVFAAAYEGLIPRHRGRRTPPSPPNWFIRPSYESRLEALYFEDFAADSRIVHQPDVYPFAAYLARHHGCEYVIDLGCGSGHKLAALASDLQTIGVDYGINIDACRRAYPGGRWIEHDLAGPDQPPIEEAVARRSVVICSDVIEHLVSPGPLLATLRRLSSLAPATVISTPERDLVRGVEDHGPPANPCHVREWNRPEFLKMLEWADLQVSFSGLTTNNNEDRSKKTILAVCDPIAGSRPAPARPGFRVLAIMTAYNEADIVASTIGSLLGEGVAVHLIDNWSTDDTVAHAAELSRLPGLTIERFPADGPSPTYRWKALLRRVEEIALSSSADWIIHHDADERRRSPWPGVGLVDALAHVESCGFNAVDHTVLDFWPIDDTFRAGTDPERHFRHFAFGAYPGHFVQVKAWKNVGPVDLASSGGHDVAFPGRRVYPYKFLLKHYPIRSDEHGHRKVFKDRRPRWDPEERTGGWHVQYDHVTDGSTFLRSPDDMLHFDDRTPVCYLTEVLSGVGIPRKAR